MNANEARMKILIHNCKELIPGFSIGYKNESRWQKFIAVFCWIFNPFYLTRYTTTSYPKVWFPNRDYTGKDVKVGYKILFHELIHLHDRKTMGSRFDLGYILPQILGLISLGALIAIWVNLWFLFFLVALVFVLPLPAIYRKNAEMRGYAASMAINYWKYGSIKPETKRWIAKEFTGASYYFMFPFINKVFKELNQWENKIKTGAILEMSPVYKMVHKIQTSSNEAVIEAAKGLD